LHGKVQRANRGLHRAKKQSASLVQFGDHSAGVTIAAVFTPGAVDATTVGVVAGATCVDAVGAPSVGAPVAGGHEPYGPYGA
jgi:hypothetical protein